MVLRHHLENIFSTSAIFSFFGRKMSGNEQKVTIMSQFSATFTSELSFSWPQANYKASALKGRDIYIYMSRKL